LAEEWHFEVAASLTKEAGWKISASEINQLIKDGSAEGRRLVMLWAKAGHYYTIECLTAYADVDPEVEQIFLALAAQSDSQLPLPALFLVTRPGGRLRAALTALLGPKHQCRRDLGYELMQHGWHENWLQEIPRLKAQWMEFIRKNPKDPVSEGYIWDLIVWAWEDLLVRDFILCELMGVGLQREESCLPPNSGLRGSILIALCSAAAADPQVKSLLLAERRRRAKDCPPYFDVLLLLTYPDDSEVREIVFLENYVLLAADSELAWKKGCEFIENRKNEPDGTNAREMAGVARALVGRFGPRRDLLRKLRNWMTDYCGAEFRREVALILKQYTSHPD
jgi:hypothetical protein